MMRFFALPALALPALALLAVMPTAGPAAQAAPPVARDLSGVTCPRAFSCWAVGQQAGSGGPRALIEHWNGRKWSLTASPSVAGSAGTFLSGVSCPARLSCWAVGGATFGSGRQEPIAEHWNGRKWSLTVLPEPAGLAADSLAGVWCPERTRCWATGSAARTASSPRLRPLAEHWTGRKWSVVPTRASGTFSNLVGVFCRRDTDCWAVGGGAAGALAEHWNGRRWSAAATPLTGGGTNSVWCPGTDCFATGNSGVPSAIAERWNGRKWSLTPTAILPMGTLSALPAVSCATSANCFAVGGANVSTLIEHWRGSRWVKVRSPNPAGAVASSLSAVFCLSARACWAVGGSTTQPASLPTRTLAEHWNGSHWSIVKTP